MRYICFMKVVTIQDGNFFRITLVPDSPAEEFMLTAIRKAEGNKAKVISIEYHEVEKVLNPYREPRKDTEKGAVMIEVEVVNFPKMMEDPAAQKSDTQVPNKN